MTALIAVCAGDPIGGYYITCRGGSYSAGRLKSLRDEHARTIEPAQKLPSEALALEHEPSDLVNAAYGLTPDEVTLM
jgi:hypothetical protein